MPGRDTETRDNPGKPGILGRYAYGLNTLTPEITTQELPPQKTASCDVQSCIASFEAEFLPVDLTSLESGCT